MRGAPPEQQSATASILARTESYILFGCTCWKGCKHVWPRSLLCSRYRDVGFALQCGIHVVVVAGSEIFAWVYRAGALRHAISTSTSSVSFSVIGCHLGLGLEPRASIHQNLEKIDVPVHRRKVRRRPVLLQSTRRCAMSMMAGASQVFFLFLLLMGAFLWQSVWPNLNRSCTNAVSWNRSS